MRRRAPFKRRSAERSVHPDKVPHVLEVVVALARGDRVDPVRHFETVWNRPRGDCDLGGEQSRGEARMAPVAKLSAAQPDTLQSFGRFTSLKNSSTASNNPPGSGRKSRLKALCKFR